MTKIRILTLSFLMGCAAISAADRVAPAEAYPSHLIGKWDATITQANIAKTICQPGYTALVRAGKTPGFGAITESIKKQVYARDGKTPDQPRCCEIDHAFPLELGGANVIANLWAESWVHPFGAKDKDRVETGLKRLVCSGQIKLVDAQVCIETDWVACGRQKGFLK